MSYYLLKTEPDTFSIDDLQKMGKSPWDGVRNYQARNIMRDSMQIGDLVLIYHSNIPEKGVAGIGKVASSSYPDPTQFDPKSPYFDPKATRDAPRWFLVDIAYTAHCKNFVTLAKIRKEKPLSDMMLLRKGARLSIQPLAEAEFTYICALGGIETPYTSS